RKASEGFALTTGALSTRVHDLATNLTQAQAQGIELSTELEQERGKSEQLGNQLQNVTNTVNTLQKQITLDPELLKKYSRVFFLSENYVPATLTDITSSGYIYNIGKIIQIHTNVWF